MLLYLFSYLEQIDSFFNVFSYLTLRAILGVLTALIICFITGPIMIRRFTDRQVGQQVREDGPESHLSKAGTPTMGGAFILLSILVSSLLWSDLSNRYVWMVMITTLLFGLIGAFDDITKLVHANSNGLSARLKYSLQSVVGLLAGYILFSTAELPVETNLYVPFFKNVVIDLGWWFIPLSYFVIVGSSNAVNLTDGLDGLAIMPAVLVAGALGVFAYASGHATFSNYLGIAFIPNAGELVVFCGAMVGAGLGFLWFNAYPAQVFMGDTGSLTIGGIIAVIAIAIRKEWLIPLLCGIFLAENLSVVLQVSYFKYTKKKYGEGRRIFKMSPLHHHYQKLGYHESKIVNRFWIVGIMLAILTVVTLKIR